MNDSRVFVVQKQLRYDAVKDVLVPKFDNLSEAGIFGNLVYLLSSNAAPFSPAPIIAELASKLADYNADRDYLLLVGNPCLIGWAVCMAASAGAGRVNLLQWSGREGRYLPIRAQGLALPPAAV